MMLTLLALVFQHGPLDPLLVGLDLGVDPGDVGPAAADAEADDADLVPLALLFADQGSTAVALKQNKCFVPSI